MRPSLSLLVLGFSSVLIAFAQYDADAGDLDWHFPPAAVPMVRQVTPSIFSAGRPDRLQISLIRKVGFASLVSVFTLPATTEWNNMTGDFVSTDDYPAIGKTLGLETRVFDFSSWTAPASFQAFAEAMDALPKPVLVHCHVGYAATSFATLYAVRTGAVPATEFYPRTLQQGFEFQTNAALNALWAHVTNSDHVPATAKPMQNLRLAGGDNGYNKYYHTKRLSDDWYVAGQPNITTELTSLKASGYGAVVSLRVDGEQEAAWPGGHYSAAVEKSALEAEGIAFFSAPLMGPITAEQLRNVGVVLAKAQAATKIASSGPVLVHCKSGYRATAATLAHMGTLDHHNWQWALRQADAIGFSFWGSEAADATTLALSEVLRPFGPVVIL